MELVHRSLRRVCGRPLSEEVRISFLALCQDATLISVIKLFNAILVASKNAEAAKTTLAAKAGVKPEVGKRKEKDNVLGRGGKDAGLTQEGFLDLVRKG